MIKNKILAVRRMSHFSPLLRCVPCLPHVPKNPLTRTYRQSEQLEGVSGLKSISGSSRLPYGTLALGAEGIKNAIKTLDDACLPHLLFAPATI